MKDDINSLPQSGIEALCMAVFKQARRDYVRCRRVLEKDPLCHSKRGLAAAADLDCLYRSFASGEMDLYAAFCPSVSAMDIWDGLVEEYENRGKQARLAV